MTASGGSGLTSSRRWTLLDGVNHRQLDVRMLGDPSEVRRRATGLARPRCSRHERMTDDAFTYAVAARGDVEQHLLEPLGLHRAKPSRPRTRVRARPSRPPRRMLGEPAHRIGERSRILRRDDDAAAGALEDARRLAGRGEDDRPAGRHVVDHLRRHELLERRMRRERHEQRVARGEDRRDLARAAAAAWKCTLSSPRSRAARRRASFIGPSPTNAKSAAPFDALRGVEHRRQRLRDPERARERDEERVLGRRRAGRRSRRRRRRRMLERSVRDQRRRAAPSPRIRSMCSQNGRVTATTAVRRPVELALEQLGEPRLPARRDLVAGSSPPPARDRGRRARAARASSARSRSPRRRRTAAASSRRRRRHGPTNGATAVASAMYER